MSFTSNQIQKIRAEFPILFSKIHDKPLVYLDNAATLHKPNVVLESLNEFYKKNNANVHRGVHTLSQRATEQYEEVRKKVCSFLGTTDTQEIIFTSGTTQSINLVAYSISDWINKGDTICVSRLEHHSNFVPWQQLALRRKANFEICELDPDLHIDPIHFEKILKTSKVKIVALTAMSNVTGGIEDIASLSTIAKKYGALVLIDAAQASTHLKLNLSKLNNIDFLAFSSHKIGGPTGVGVLWGKKDLLEKMPPFQFGGDMISLVTDDKTLFNELPYKFEAGTPNFADTVAMGAAIDYIQSLGIENISQYEGELLDFAVEKLEQIEGLEIFGSKNLNTRGAVISFSIKGLHPHDLAHFLDHQGIAIRAGHHCAYPLIKKYGFNALNRASFSFYNTFEEIEVFFASLLNAKKYFKRSGEKRDE